MSEMPGIRAQVRLLSDVTATKRPQRSYAEEFVRSDQTGCKKAHLHALVSKRDKN